MVKVTMTRELALFSLIFILGVVAAQSCNSCGSECQSACGTRHFRTCCFNYLKKRSPNVDPLPLTMDPSLRLELWLAKSKYPYFQPRNFLENSLEMPSDANDNHNHDSQLN